MVACSEPFNVRFRAHVENKLKVINNNLLRDNLSDVRRRYYGKATKGRLADERDRLLRLL